MVPQHQGIFCGVIRAQFHARLRHVCPVLVALLQQVAMLNALGAGFDCASVQELKCAAAHDVPQDRVIFANPCKRPADFR